MKIKFNVKYNTIAFYTVLVFAVCILLVLLAFRLDVFISVIRRIMTAISPVIWGLVIAYIMNPLVRKLESVLSRKVFKKKKQANLCRSLSIVGASLIGVLAIVSVIAMAVPQIVESISTLFNNMPDYLNSFYVSMLEYLEKHPEINDQVTEWFEQQFADAENLVLGWINDLKPAVEKYLILIKDGLFNFLIGVKDFLLGYIVSVYLLFSKEHFITQFKKLCSLIIGMLCFIVLVIFQIPNAMLISFIVGITNMIPFFGPFIGAIPSAVLVILTAPQKTLAFIIIILVIQQFDGNIIGPKIIGNKLNLPTFWIMFSIFFFGNLFGFIGMLAGVPVFAVIYTLTKEFVDERIRFKNIDLLKKSRDEEAEELKAEFEDEDIFTE